MRVYPRVGGAVRPPPSLQLVRARLDTIVPFCSSIQIALVLLFQNGEKAIFTAETVAQWNCPIFAKQALSNKISGGPLAESVDFLHPTDGVTLSWFARLWNWWKWDCPELRVTGCSGVCAIAGP